MSKPVDWLKNNWQDLAQGAAWLLGLFSTFIYPPPANSLDLSLGRADTGFNAARFVVTLVLAAAFFLARRYVRKSGIWLALAALTLGAASVLYFDYQSRAERWTATYNGGLVTRGDQLTTHAAQYAKENSIELSRSGHSKLIFDFGGNAAAVWADTDVITSRWRELVLRYVATACLLTLCVVTVLQATRR